MRPHGVQRLLAAAQAHERAAARDQPEAEGADAPAVAMEEDGGVEVDPAAVLLEGGPVGACGRGLAPPRGRRRVGVGTSSREGRVSEFRDLRRGW